MDALITRSVQNIQLELSELDHIRLYAPIQRGLDGLDGLDGLEGREGLEGLEEYNDNLLGFKRLYHDSYRFLKRFITLGKLDYILTLYPRHIYWNLTPKQLNYLISLLNGLEMDIVKYLLDLNLHKSDRLYNKYISLLGDAKLEYIKLKNVGDNMPEHRND